MRNGSPRHPTIICAGRRIAPLVPEAEIEVGGRVWYSSGRFQKDLSTTLSQTLPGLLMSRD